MYKLYSSFFPENPEYRLDLKMEDPKNLISQMEWLDEQGFVWYVEGPDGETDFRYICRVHKERLGVEFVAPKLEELRKRGKNNGN